MTDDELRSKNADLGNKINEVLRNHPELRGVADEIALKQGLWVQVGTPFLVRMHANLQERARAIIERRPDLERLFDALTADIEIRTRATRRIDEAPPIRRT